MSPVFIDTSALLALRNSGDAHHGEAREAFSRLAAREAVLVTTSYVLCETYALLGRRFGLAEVSAFRSRVAPLLSVRWVDDRLHDAGLDLLEERRLKDLSLVDAVSFVVMRKERMEEAFAYDGHFDHEGFRAP